MAASCEMARVDEPAGQPGVLRRVERAPRCRDRTRCGLASSGCSAAQQRRRGPRRVRPRRRSATDAGACRATASSSSDEPLGDDQPARQARGCARRRRRRRRRPVDQPRRRCRSRRGRAAAARAGSATRRARRRRGARRRRARRARCSVAPSWGARSAAERISTDAAGFCFCGIADDPPPTPSESSPISVRAERGDVCREHADRIDRLHQGIAEFGDGPAGRVPGRVGSGERELGGERGRKFRGAHPPRTARRTTRAFRRRRRAVPAAPARGIQLGSTRPLHCRAASSPRAGPTVVGTACWVRVRAAATSVAVCAARTPPARPRSTLKAATTSRAARAATSMSAESRMSWLVAPRCTSAVGPDGIGSAAADERDHRVASGDGCRGERPPRRSRARGTAHPARSSRGRPRRGPRHLPGSVAERGRAPVPARLRR